ncbi:unnamed protein product [Vitrella brassicaformis CCMP3155]|uniref:Uncharacterized protein n=1 Tax=Vitrella brassicaformis (strain CCMP3155) TaxID=1169540 RepID=A0A0G4F8A8_VITBC|nr:unnamed protein product [Vitrella brassicaformis CCMP3155]|eukprot:CEM08773.1 unnamed protein product [Vitrella brassicaformis CCMP3155]
MIAAIDVLSAHTLRIGAILELTGVIFLHSLFLTGCTSPLFDVYAASMTGQPVDDYEEKMKAAIAAVRHWSLPSLYGQVPWMTGALFILGFQVKLTADPWLSSRHRLFRLGIGVLQIGAFLDVTWNLVNLAEWVIAVNYVKASDATITALIEGGFFWWPEMLYVSFLSLAVLLYGVSFMLLDVHHPEGGSTCLAWTLLVSWTLTGTTAFLRLLVPPSLAALSVVVAIDTAWPLFLILSLVLTVVWSFLFEPAVNRGIYAEAGGADDYGPEHTPPRHCWAAIRRI